MPLPSVDQPARTKPGAPALVHYIGGGAALPVVPDTLLGAVGYGGGRPDFLPLSCPFIGAPLTPASSGDTVFEIWSASSPTRACRHGPVAGACSDAIAFGALTLEEDESTPLEATVEAAYHAIFDFLDATGFTAPLRFWNYLTAITAEDRGLERYRRFNIGRHQAFSARLRQPVPPAASGVGGHTGASIIYFVAAHEPAQAVENPRQVSAYEYPNLYGPRSPSFSRASVHRKNGTAGLFISGTASIVGHETRHPGNLAGQIAETAENLRALIAAATTAATLFGTWAVKIYLHDPAAQAAANPMIDAVFGPDCQRLYLHSDICRPDLLIEVEAFATAR